MPRYILVVVLLLGVISPAIARGRESPSVNSRESIDSMVYDAVERLPEIRKFMHVDDSLNGDSVNSDSINSDSTHAMLFIKSRPAGSEQYYWVQVGVDDGYRLIPVYNFYVYHRKRRMVVRVLDTATDRVLTLAEWRRKNRSRRKCE